MEANFEENTILMCPKIIAMSHYATNTGNYTKSFKQTIH